MPEEARELVGRLEAATAAMTALEEEVEALLHRVEKPDIAAIHLGVRRIAEALVRHATREEGIPFPKNPGLGPLKGELRSKSKKRMTSDFWAYLDFIQHAVNPDTHYQDDDVYKPAGFRRSSPWDKILSVFRALVCVAEEFKEHWRPPAELVVSTSDTDETPADFAQEEDDDEVEADSDQLAGGDDEVAAGDEAAADDEAVADDEAEAAAPAARRRDSSARRRGQQPARPRLTTDQARALLDLTVAQVRDNPQARALLASASGLHARGVSRRINATHGSTKLRRLFPALLAELVETDDEAEVAQPRLDYQAIGNLTIKRAREFELAGEIAALTGFTVATVKRKLKGLHGGWLVRRQFPWYFADTIGKLTVRTALQYDLAPVLAAGLRERRPSVVAKLRAAAGQTKLRTVFPKLIG